MDWSAFGAGAVAVPFEPKGRSLDGWDCWGLVVCAYRDVLGVSLPSYDEQYDTTRDVRRMQRLFREGREARWREVPRTVGAVAAILRRNRCIHAGIAMPGQDVLHCERKAGTILEPERYLRVEGFWVPAWLN